MKIDYCTMFPESWRGIDISECCKTHDETLSTSKFYSCLRSKLSIVESLAITAGGAIGCWVKYPRQMWSRL